MARRRPGQLFSNKFLDDSLSKFSGPVKHPPLPPPKPISIWVIGFWSLLFLTVAMWIGIFVHIQNMDEERQESERLFQAKQDKLEDKLQELKDKTEVLEVQVNTLAGRVNDLDMKIEKLEDSVRLWNVAFNSSLTNVEDTVKKTQEDVRKLKRRLKRSEQEAWPPR